jgi:hypothetical protein
VDDLPQIPTVSYSKEMNMPPWPSPGNNDQHILTAPLLHCGAVLLSWITMAINLLAGVVSGLVWFICLAPAVGLSLIGSVAVALLFAITGYEVMNEAMEWMWSHAFTKWIYPRTLTTQSGRIPAQLEKGIDR